MATGDRKPVVMEADIVNDLTTGGTSMALSAEMGKKLKTELDTRVNPNLLDNWYFGNPVNQRGKTEYTGTGYTIDRWKLTNPNGTLSMGDDGIALVGRAGNIWLQEYLENAAELYGKQVTLSVIADGKLYSTTGTVQTEAVSPNIDVCLTSFTNGNIGLYKNAAGGLFVQLHAVNTKTVVYYAVKLELGTQQTLAHQDADGNWVLNEIPNYAEELAKCQRYQYVINIENNGLKFFGQGAADSAGTSAQIAVPLPCNMRAYPTLTTAGTFLLYGIGKNETAAVSAVTVFRGAQSGQVLVKVASSGLTAGALYQLITNDANARIILDANL